MTFLLLVSFRLMFLFHPVHLTVTNLEYVNNQHAFVAKIRFFRDDFTKILYIKFKQKPDFKKKNKPTTQLIRNYLAQNFILYINGVKLEPKKIQVKDYKIEDITLWVTVKIPYHKPVKSIKIQDKLMMDLYMDQRNLLIFTYKNVQKAYTFTKNKNTVKLTL